MALEVRLVRRHVLQRDDARFKKPVIPGDQLELEVTFERALRGIGKFSCVARVGGGVVAQATIMCSLRAVDPL